MTFIVDGTNGLTFPNSTTQAVAALPLTGGQLSGNLTFASGTNGIIFNNSSALTNSTLNDYETGTWTPSCTNSGLTSYTSGGKYTKVGNMVYLAGYVSITSAGTASGQMTVSNLPFSYYTSGGNIQATGVCREAGATGLEYYFNSQGNQTTFSINSATNGAVAWVNGYTYAFSITYQTTF
jgi:hypothetical protein